MAGASVSWGWRLAAALQALLAAVVLCAIGFAPPVHGRTLLIPLDRQPISRALLDRKMLLRLNDGPLPGSVVVEGPGRALAATLFDQGIIMVAAPAALCSERPEGEGKRWKS